MIPSGRIETYTSWDAGACYCNTQLFENEILSSIIGKW
jgi:hypothetical protein